MSGEVGAAEAGLPPFCAEDIIRLFAGSYLPLCRALGQTGAIDAARLSARILARLGDEREAPWAALAISLAHVLLSDADRSGR